MGGGAPELTVWRRRRVGLAGSAHARAVGGSEAVSIMERPSLGTALTDLADYASARMFNAYARKANIPGHRGYVPYQGANNLQITMTNGGTTLSSVSPIDTYSMRFDWQHFH